DAISAAPFRLLDGGRQRRPALPAPPRRGFRRTRERNCVLDSSLECGALGFKCSRHRGALCRANDKVYCGRKVVNAHCLVSNASITWKLWPLLWHQKNENARNHGGTGIIARCHCKTSASVSTQMMLGV